LPHHSPTKHCREIIFRVRHEQPQYEGLPSLTTPLKGRQAWCVRPGAAAHCAQACAVFCKVATAARRYPYTCRGSPPNQVERCCRVGAGGTGALRGGTCARIPSSRRRPRPARRLAVHLHALCPGPDGHRKGAWGPLNPSRGDLESLLLAGRVMPARAEVPAQATANTMLQMTSAECAIEGSNRPPGLRLLLLQLLSVPA